MAVLGDLRLDDLRSGSQVQVPEGPLTKSIIEGQKMATAGPHTKTIAENNGRLQANSWVLA